MQRTSKLLDVFIQYEADWTERKLITDYVPPSISEEYQDPRFRAEILADAFDAAMVYAKRTSIGDVYRLSSFMENSMRRSERPEAYLQKMHNELVRPERRALFIDSYRKAVGRNVFNQDLRVSKPKVFSDVLNLVHDTLFDREQLNDKWAGDCSLWYGSKPQVVIAETTKL